MSAVLTYAYPCAYPYLELLDQAAERFNSRDVGPPRSRPGTRVDTISPGIILTPACEGPN